MIAVRVYIAVAAVVVVVEAVGLPVHCFFGVVSCQEVDRSFCLVGAVLAIGSVGLAWGIYSAEDWMGQFDHEQMAQDDH
jgi:hypothetical protein